MSNARRLVVLAYQINRPAYSLTAMGRDLMPVLLELFAWGAKHNSNLDILNGFLEHYANNREQLMSLLKPCEKALSFKHAVGN